MRYKKLPFYMFEIYILIVVQNKNNNKNNGIKRKQQYFFLQWEDIWENCKGLWMTIWCRGFWLWDEEKKWVVLLVDSGYGKGLIKF